MNLHEIASNAINAVNPFQPVVITPREDYIVNEFGEAEPLQNASYTIMAQVQPMQSEDIKFINNYNQSSVYKAFWVSANTFGVNRPMLRGGDKVEWNGKTFDVVNMPEDWYETCGWSHFIGCLQLEANNGYV